MFRAVFIIFKDTNGALELKENKARVLIITSAILWGTSFPIIKIGLSYTSPILFVFLRFLLATIIMIPIIMVNNIKIKCEDLKGLVGLSGFLNATAYILQFIGQRYTYATNAALMVNTSPIFTALFAHFLLREKLGKVKIFGIITTFLGVYVIIFGLKLPTGIRMLGDIICLLAGAIWGLYMTIAKRIEESINELKLITIWFIYNVLFSAIALPLEDAMIVLTPITALVIIYTATICTIIPFFLWYNALKLMDASTSSNYFMIEILVSALLEAILIGAEIRFELLIGALLIILGVYITDALGKNSGKNK